MIHVTGIATCTVVESPGESGGTAARPIQTLGRMMRRSHRDRMRMARCFRVPTRVESSHHSDGVVVSTEVVNTLRLERWADIQIEN